MTAPEELYAAILADPDDMELRLRYADAVEGSDPEHAELIRLQIEYDESRMAGRSRADSGSGRIIYPSGALTERLSRPIAHLVTRVGLRRGFPELVVLTGSDFLNRGEEIYRLAPVRHALLTRVGPEIVPALAASPLLNQLRSLDLGDNPIGDEGARALVSSPNLRNLRWLGLEKCKVGPGGAEALAASAPVNLPALRYLRLPLIVPYAYWDSLSPVEAPPTIIQTPPLGVKLNALYGPFEWLDQKWAETNFVDFSQV